MKNSASLLLVFVCGCGASAGDPSVDYGGAGGAENFGAGSGGTGGATAFAGAGSTGLGGSGFGGTAGAFGSGGTSGESTNVAGAFAGGGMFGAAGGGAAGGGAAGGGAMGGSAGHAAGGSGGAFGGNGGAAGHAAGGSAGMGGSGASAGSAGSSAQVCTSKKTWTSGNGPDMRPGNACQSCHGFTIAGTVFPTLNEPMNCDGTSAGGLKVLITGADNVTLTLTPSTTSGNFYSNTTVKTPFSVKLTNAMGASRSMVSHQTTGNCNSCHTPTGSNGAPGRIMAP